MSRKLFISFLGISRYEAVRYYYETEGKEFALAPEHFIQISLIRKLSNVFEEDDMIVIFLTGEAEKRNWLDKANFENGLQTQLKELQENGVIAAQVRHISNLKEGFSTDEVWEIFQKILEVIQPGDEIFLDITHAFRHIPMLALTLMSYASAVKGSQVKAIYYGAFERILNEHKIGIGAIGTVPVEKRLAPVLNLLSLVELQQWSFAANSFINSGAADSIALLGLKQAHSLLKEANGQHAGARQLRDISKQIAAVYSLLATCRGKELQTQKILNETRELLHQMRDSGTFLKPFESLLVAIDKKLSMLSNTQQAPWFDAANWCFEHNMVQQGITILQEGVITEVIGKLSSKLKLEIGHAEHRNMVSMAFHISIFCKVFEEWHEMAKKNKHIIESILEMKKIDVLIHVFSIITEFRNSINHAGFLEDDHLKAAKFKEKLGECIWKLRENYFICDTGIVDLQP